MHHIGKFLHIFVGKFLQAAEQSFSVGAAKPSVVKLHGQTVTGEVFAGGCAGKISSKKNCQSTRDLGCRWLLGEVEDAWIPSKG